jgi:hypothetical protein
VFLTGNLGSDGVGDTLKAHSRNRLTVIRVSKPDSDQWLEWAVNADIDPVVMSWVHQFPHCLSSYLDEGNDSNPYIFNPKKQQDAFVTPRSLELASNIVKVRERNDSAAMIAALAGTIGESAARDMQAYIEYQDQLPHWDSIIKSPKTAKVPDAPGACAVLVFGAITKITAQSMTPFMDYLDRFSPEWQAVFAINVARNPDRQKIAFSSKAFADWVSKNEDIL